MVYSLAGATMVAALLVTAVLAESQRARLSPRGEAVAELSGKTIRIEYGRPYRKGRPIFGGLIPYGKLWRTGADEATALASDGGLVVGGLRVPPGGYSLFTIPGTDTWKLIINRDPDLRSPAQYNRKHDLGRVDMSIARSVATIEQLTIVIQKTGETTAVLSIAWENVVASVNLALQE